MTISMRMTRHSQQPRTEHKPRRRLDSLLDMPTHLITLSPAFLDALRKVAPKGRRRTLRYVLVLAAIVSIAIAYGRRIFPLHHDATAHVTAVAPPPVATPTPTAAVSAVMAPSGRRPPEIVATNASGSAPAAAPTTVLGGGLPRAATTKPPKAMKKRTPQVPQ